MLVGREREQRLLHDMLEGAIRGHGALALISGDAGIGKTALVRDLAARATERGVLTLTGSCYDSGAPPAYSPWRELLSDEHQRRTNDQFPLSNEGWMEQAATPDAFVTTLHRRLDIVADRGPLLVILEDLHWADPESLEFLRLFARRIATRHILLLATYRDTDLPFNDALYQVLPHLVRESDGERIVLHALDEAAIAALVTRRYGLSLPDKTRLTTNLEARSQGVPFYLLELLRTLEEEQQLRPTAGGWTLGAIDQTGVPLLVKQVVDTRLKSLGVGAHRLLERAAVIGRKVPLALLRRVSESDMDNDEFADALERAMRSHLLAAESSPMHLQFTHTLVRDSLYEGIPLARRQRWHREIAEALVDDGGIQPDVIAHHFRQAFDLRAVGWFVRASTLAERIAWATAAHHLEAAIEMMASGQTDPGERGWLLVRRASLLRNAEPRTALAILDTAEALAVEAHDAVLLACVSCYRGQLRCVSGELKPGLVDLQEGIAAFERLTPSDRARVAQFERHPNVMSQTDFEGLLAAVMAVVGRIEEALTRTQAMIDGTNDISTRAWVARGVALALIGQPREANEAFLLCRDALKAVSDESTTLTMILYQISLVQIPYSADNLADRRRLGAEGEAAWLRSAGAHGDGSPRLPRLPEFMLEGNWREAREVALSGIQSSETSEKHLFAMLNLAQLAQAQGDTVLVWQLIRRALPAGYHTIPGNNDLKPSLALMRVAAALSLDDGNLVAAHAWLEAHDRWLEWSGAVLWQADGQILWAQRYRSAGNLGRALQHVAQALLLARAPRQPLALLAAHRLQGEIETQIGHFADARRDLDAALVLAEACAAIYERALTLLALADLERRVGESSAARSMLEEARSIFEALGATPALARTDELSAHLGDGSRVESFAEFDLTPREVEVLRLLANGGRNREIADELFLSARTVERHIANLYAKIGVTSRSEAIAFAYAHHLHESQPQQ